MIKYRQCRICHGSGNYCQKYGEFNILFECYACNGKGFKKQKRKSTKFKIDGKKEMN